MTAIPDDIMQAAYDAADEAELLCGANGVCHRHDCNGYLCRNAIDAATKVERERCAQIARDAHVAHTPQTETYSVDIASAITSQTGGAR